jgi:hypothetical protein
MAISNLSFSATEKLRKDLLVRNLEPYYVKNSSTQLLPKSQVGTKEYIFDEVPLINQPDLKDTGLPEKSKLYGVNQYGPTGGYTTQASLPLLVKSSNQGEFDWPNAVTKKFNESLLKQKELIVTNQYGPQDGWSDASSELNVNIVQPNIRDEYYNFIASSYSPFQILTKRDPVGSEGSLSQDSNIAKIAATRLKKLFEESIAFETYQQTLGRANVLQTNSDPYRILNLITGRQPILEPDWKITVPSTLVGRGIDFISRVAGLYSPYSIIPGDYFSRVPKASLTNQIVNAVAGLFGFPNVLPTKKTSSDVFLSFTSGGQRKALFSNLSVNRYAPDYKGNFLGNLNLSAPPGNYYIGSRTSEPLDIVSPSGEIPVNEFGVEVETNVYGPSVLGKLYEDNVDLPFGLNLTSTIDGGGVQGGFTWVSPKYKGNAGQKIGQGGEKYGQDSGYQPIAAQYTNSESTNFPFKKGSILDDTQRIIESQPAGSKKLQHVGNAIDQVSKVFNDGYKEITKGSRVIKYVDNNGIFKGEEYGRVFAKDIPYYDLTKLQKSDGNIRKNPFSILTNTYNLNMYPTSGPESTTLGGGSVKKYMLSLENLAWRTSRRPGTTYNDLPESERGPNGGRIMWFPPYDLTFSDSNSVGWEKNSFLGRPEPIYTYQNTERTGSLSFKIIVDHPSVMNLLVNKVLTNTSSSQVADQVLESFFAGLTKFDVYELSKRFTNFSQTELSYIQQLINTSGDPEKIKNLVNGSLPKGGDGAGGSMDSNNSVGLPVYTPQLTQFKNSIFYYDVDNGGGNDYLTSVTNYLESANANLINDTQLSDIEQSKKVLTAFTESINNVLQSNANLKIKIKIKSGSAEGEPVDVQEERGTCLLETLKSLTKDNPRVSYTEEFVGNLLETLTEPPYDCNTVNLNYYETGPVACRRSVITDIIEIPEPNLNNPNGGISTQPTSRLERLLGINPNQNNTSLNNRELTQEQLSKQVIRKLLSEADYFQFVRESNPFIYDSLREKLKYFHPAFHAMTPEGLNERLTFLLQCTRPGDTIPTKQGTQLIDKDARNTSFGAPPICVLRVGDFYHSKVVIDSCNFTYEDSKFDLNPEGIGVQPMIVGVSLGFKFIGGQGLRGPIDELQNALSFNFFANTEMYDERATDSASVSAYNKEFIEQTQPEGETPQNATSNVQNEGGTTIGAIQGAFENSGATATVIYKPIFNEFVDSFVEYANTVYNKLEEVNKEYNDGILMLFTKSRLYSKGKINEWGGGSAKEVTIFGKSDYENSVDNLFSNLLNDISNNALTMQIKLQTKTFKESSKTVFKNNLTNLVNSKKSTFRNKLVQVTNELNTCELKMVRAIDKINYVLQSVDGYIDTKGSPQVYETTTASTVTNLTTNMDEFATLINNLNTNLIDSEIITNKYDDNQSYSLPGNGFSDNVADKRFFLVFGKELVSDSSSLTDLLLAQLDNDWKKYVKEQIELLKKQAENENKVMSNKFSTYKKQNQTNKVYLPEDIAFQRNEERSSGLSLKSSPSDNENTRLKNLYLGQNSNPDTNTFNGKVTF